MDAIVDIFCWSMRVLSGGVVAIGAGRPGAVAGHRRGAGCSWSQEAGFGVPGLGTKPHHTSKEMCWRRNAGCGGILWTRRTQDVFNFLHVCLCLCACVCVRLCSACMSSCVLSHLQVLGSSVRSRGVAGLLSCGTRSNFTTRSSTQSRLQKLTWEMIRVDQKPPRLRAKGAETRHLEPCCYELAMDFHKQQRSAHSLTVRGLFEQLFGLYMTMSVEPFDSAACARCSRQFCTLYKTVSKRGLRRQPVEAEAEDAHGPGDARSAV